MSNHRRTCSLVAIVFVILAIGVNSCRKIEKPVVPSAQRSIAEHTDSVSYTDVTAAAGITWKHINGSDGRMFFPEQHAGGAAIIDFDNDGWEDIIIAQCRHWPGHRPAVESTMVLYRNNHNGTFTDVTKQAGLAIPMFTNGVSVGDYDNDGWPDVYFTNFGVNYLFHNDHGVFRDVTKEAKVGGYGHWSSSAMWIDYDNDGFLDLFVAHYVNWTPETDLYCTLDGKDKNLCSPVLYAGETCQLFHNNHDGTFSDASKQTGITNQVSKALGLAMIDFDEDGWTDILVACDQSPNRLLHNDHGVFKDIGVEAGIAYDEGGVTRAGMGIDWADVDRDGKPTVMIGNFSSEMDWVYKYNGNGTFIDRAPVNGIGKVSQPYLTFGLVLFDFDYDGWPDMFSANGHVRPGVEKVLSTTSYRQQSLLFRNLKNGKFEEVGLQYLKGPFEKYILGRNVSICDFNNDGNLDLFIVNLDDYPILLQCERKNTNHFLRIKLQGVKSNRDGIGAMIYAKVGAMNMVDMMKSGSSFQGSNETWVSLGLGQATQVDQLIIKWNCGTVDTLRNIAADRKIVVKEGTNAAEDFHCSQ